MCYDCLDLFKVIQFAVDTSKDKTTEDTMHDINATINDIFLSLKHLIRNEETCFWLKDFCQKIILVRFREGQKEFFGKKSMHVDVMMKVVNITEVVIKLQFKLPQALISRGFTQRTVFHAPAFQQKGLID